MSYLLGLGLKKFLEVFYMIKAIGIYEVEQ